MKQPVLWDGDFVCTCGHRAHADVLGRKGHRYDELELSVTSDTLPPDERPTAEEKDQLDQFIHETYTSEGLGVLAVVPCPKCGTRPGLKKELRKMALYFVVLIVMVGLTSGMLYGFGDQTAAVGVLIAAGFAVVARTYTFIAATLEAKDRVRFQAP